MNIHQHLVPKKKKYRVKIVEERSGKATHVVYGIWAALVIMSFVKINGRRPSKSEFQKSYGIFIRTLGFL